MGKLRTLLISQLLCAGFVNIACAHSEIWTSKGDLSSYEVLEESLKTHSVIILGENHELKEHQNQQLQIMNSLRKMGKSVDVGMEFFSYPHQDQVDLYRTGQMSEADFLKNISWGNQNTYEFYRAQANFPDYSVGERTWALNAPRSLTGAIAKSGLTSLSPELKSLLPPQFALGRDSYRTRFLKTMEGHITDPQKLQNYFEAQSVWDDTMAWRVETFKKDRPGAVMVIVVGEFHAQYGGGLPDRLKARGISDVLVISQVNTLDMQPDEIQKQIQPDPEYGPRADWIWTAPAVD